MKKNNFSKIMFTFIAVMAFWEFFYFTPRILESNGINLSFIKDIDYSERFSEYVSGDTFEEVLDKGLNSLDVDRKNIIHIQKRFDENMIVFSDQMRVMRIARAVKKDNMWYFMEATK